MKEKAEKPRNRFRSRSIILIIIVLAAVPLLLFRIVTGKIVDNITQSISLQYSQELNAQMSSHIASTFDYYFHELNTEYNAVKLIDDLDEEKLTAFIAEIPENDEISYLAFVDDDGYVYEADGSYPGTMRIPMLGKLLNGTKRVVEDNETVGNSNYIMLGSCFDEPIVMEDKSICIALLGIDNNDLASHIVLQSDYSGGFSSIIHTNGSYVVKNSAETADGLNVFSILEKNNSVAEEEISALRSAIESGESYTLTVSGNGDEDSSYLYFAPVEDSEWYIVNTLPSSFIKNSIVDLRDTMEKVYIVFVVLFLIIAAVVVIQQMTSNRKLRNSQVELENALRIAEEASGAKTAFLFSMSHDIRTPMNAILGYTDIGLRHVDDAELAQDSYQKIKMAGGHLLNLINDILEMSRIESGKMALAEKPLDLRKAISDVTVMSQSLALEKSIDYNTVSGEIRNPYVYADELHLNEVLINIISNAVKYTPEKGKVSFTVNQLDEEKDGKTLYRFEIADNGIGMSEEFQTHLFETFSREENSTISKTEGTGLGLSIVKRIVDMAGGEIRVHSVQDEGSVFTVDIPFRILAEQDIETFIADTKEAQEISSEISLIGKRVLLAEDNELNREIATFILEDAGMEVDTAEDGSVAVNVISEKGVSYYDFILMDIQMPIMNGYEATKKIRELPGGDSIPIIALSANAFEEDKKKSIDEGMNAHVAKPIDIKELLETIHGFLK